MIDDPYTYDRAEFAEAWLWASLYWNMAESKARSLLQVMLNGGEPTLAIIADMGTRSLRDALTTAGDHFGEQSLQAHVRHFVKGLSVLGEYRNFYVHGLHSMEVVAEKKGHIRILEGRLMTIAAKGNLRFLDQALPTKDVVQFLDRCLSLVRYGEAIMREMGDENPFEEFSIALGQPAPSLEKPVWPSPPDRAYHSSSK